MNKSRHITLLLFFLLHIPFRAFVQESKVTLNGYVKDLYMFYTPENHNTETGTNNLSTNIIHNRFNLKWYATQKLTAVVEMRNRLMFGNLVKDFPAYKQMVDVDKGLLDLSWIAEQSNSWFLHSMIDRMYFDYSSAKWQIRAGRQRVNWGVNLVWNPNDIFNTFSYFDFDYEERPGTDALRIQYYTGATSSAELVYKPGRTLEKTATAALYRFSQWDYDFQFIGGQAGNDWITGSGWSGNIYGAGFRGEITHFEPLNNQSFRATVASISSDYTFKNSLYLHFSVLYNSSGKTENAGQRNFLFNTEMSAKQLSLARWSLFGQISKPITPLFSGSLSGILNPSDGSMYLGPAFTYSVANNIELMLTSQLFFGASGTEYGDIGRLIFGRIRWSF